MSDNCRTAEEATAFSTPSSATQGAAGQLRRAARSIRQHLNLPLVVALIVGLGMLAYVSYVANARKSGDQLSVILQQVWPIAFLLIFPYLAAEALVWHEL